MEFTDEELWILYSALTGLEAEMCSSMVDREVVNLRYRIEDFLTED